MAQLRPVMLKLKFFFPLCVLLLSACSKLATPVPGNYRAYVELRGGAVPFELTVDEQAQLWLVQNGNPSAATELKLQDGSLQAQLPNGIGMLQARIGRNEWQGELRVTDIQGKLQTLPLTAELEKQYRFVQQASTDNADVSGYWQLEAISPNHFSTPVTLQLSQTHDSIDGQLLLADGQPLAIYGQAQGDTIYLSSLSQGRALLFKGKVNAQGELQGELWINLSTAQTAIARRMPDSPVESEEGLRKVALPWAVPTR